MNGGTPRSFERLAFYWKAESVAGSTYLFFAELHVVCSLNRILSWGETVAEAGSKRGRTLPQNPSTICTHRPNSQTILCRARPESRPVLPLEHYHSST